MSKLNKRLPELYKKFSGKIIGGRASLRTTTADHLPVVGPLFSERAYKDAYKGLRFGQRYPPYKMANKLNGPKGLFIFDAFGSHGLSLCSFTSEILAAQIFGLPIPADQRVVDGLNPARFVIRKLKKNYNF